MSRRAPPNAERRREYIVANGLIPGARVLDTGLNQFAFVVDHTAKNMVRIRYEGHAKIFKTVAPSRLFSSPLAGPIVLLGATDNSPSFASNRHRVRIVREDERAFYGLPVDNPNVTEPLEYPRFAWRIIDAEQDRLGAIGRSYGAELREEDMRGQVPDEDGALGYVEDD